MKTILLVILFILFLSACEEVIELDLKTVEPRIVIEAIVNDEMNAAKVVISKSTDFYKPGKYVKISDATIILTDDNGNETNFIEFENGTYFSEQSAGAPNTNYKIKVIADDAEYKATSFMPEPILIDSVRIRKNETGGRGKGGIASNIRLQVYFQDKENVKNYARIKIYQNGNLVTGHYMYFDRLTDGNNINYPVFLDAEKDYKVGDLITVELQSIDKATFDYFNTLTKVLTSNNTSGPGNAPVAPANPTTNWSNNSLGYFSAYSVSVDSIYLPER